MGSFDIRKHVTDAIITALENGTAPWRQMWRSGLPRNLNGRAYRGLNVFILGSAPFSTPWWGTAREFAKRGYHIRKGEHFRPVVLWKFLDIEDKETGKTKRVPMLRYFKVCNVEQVVPFTNATAEQRAAFEQKFLAEPTTVADSADADATISSYRQREKLAVITDDHAYYSPTLDIVGMPAVGDFLTSGSYYSTMFHELAHSTGHANRLGRFKADEPVATFGSESYSQEELVAEMTAAFLVAEHGIETDDTLGNSAAYCGGWLKRLNDDRQMLLSAAGKAQHAADRILGRNVSTSTEDDDE